jgi:PAS domain S-box-containing protein
MKLRTKLLIGCTAFMLLILTQGAIHWWQSFKVSNNVRQLEGMLFHQSKSALGMAVTLGDLESHLLSYASTNGDFRSPQDYVRDGSFLLQKFATSVSEASRINTSGELRLADAESISGRARFAEREKILKQLQANCIQLLTNWQSYTRDLELPTFSEHEHLAKTHALALAIHSALRAGVTQYEVNLASETFTQTHTLIATTRTSRALLLITAALLAIAALVWTAFLTRLVLRPIGAFIATARAIMGGNRGVRIEHTRTDEFGAMANTFNGMLDALQETTISRDELEILLRKRTAELERFFSVSPDPMAISDTHGHRLRVNPAFGEALGYTEQELMAIRVQDTLHPDDLAVFQNGMDRLATRQSERADLELRYMTKDGLWRTLAWKAALSPEENLVYAVGRDVTALRRTTEALRESEQQLATTLDSIGDGVLSTDKQGCVARLNPLARELTGWDLADAVGRHVDEIVLLMNEATGTSIPNPVHRVLSEGTSFGLPARIALIARDGKQHPIAISCASIRDSKDVIRGAVLVFRDVTREREAEQRLIESAAMLRTLSNSLPSGAAFRAVEAGAPMKARFLFISEGIERLTGISVAEIMADAEKLLQLIHPDDWEPMRRAYLAAKDGNSQFDCQTRITTTKGETRWIHWRSLPQRPPTGETVWDGLIVDITPLKSAEEQLRALNDNLEQKVRERTLALEESERRLSSLFRALPAGVGIVRNRIQLEITQRICEISGYSSEELVGKDARCLYPSKEDYDAVGRSLYSLVRERTIGSIETRWRRKDGRVIDVLLSSCQLDPTDPLLLIITVTDITDLKRAQAQVNVLSQAIEQSPVAVVITTPSAEIEYVNPRFTELTGYQPVEVLGKNPRLLQSGLTPSEEYRQLWNTISAGGRWCGQFRNKKKNAELYWESCSISPIRDAQGALTHYLAFKEDITERRKTDERIREQAALLDQTRDAILVLDLDGKVRYHNLSAARLHSEIDGTLNGHSADEFLFLGQPLRCADVCGLTILRGEWSGELHLAARQAQARIVRSRWTLIRNAGGDPQNFLVTNTDITEQKRLEEQLLRAQRMESVGTLAGGVAHDLNNILTPLLIATDLFRPILKNTEHEALVEMLNDCAKRGAGIVRQLLVFGRGLPGHRTDLQPLPLIKEILKVVQETFPKSITLESHLASDLWQINADATQIHQVLLNLCVNARDAMPKGGQLVLSAENVTLDEFFVETHPEAKVGRHILVQVADTGTGIPREILDRIFDPFFTTKEQGKGTGLGLSTVLGIVKGHQGFIEVLSRLGRGTQFQIYLPAVESTASKPTVPERLSQPGGNNELILVVDDEEAIRNASRRILEKNGYRVVTATDGAEGLITYVQRASEIDAVLTDLLMPGMDGMALIRSLRGYALDLPVVAMSGLPEQEQELKAAGVKISAFVRKPFSSEELLNVMHHILRKEHN